MLPAAHATDERPALADRLPTLTEVVELGLRPAAPASDPGPAELEPPLPVPVTMDSGTLVEQVMLELTPRIDQLLESRLRDALAPALARAADGLIRDARTELSQALRDLVAEAVARARRGDHGP
jgi:hypothetical protein